MHLTVLVANPPEKTLLRYGGFRPSNVKIQHQRTEQPSLHGVRCGLLVSMLSKVACDSVQHVDPATPSVEMDVVEECIDGRIGFAGSQFYLDA